MNVENIPLADIHADNAWNSRGQILYQDLRALADSIQRDGLQQPIVVCPCSNVPGKKYRVVAGFSRLAAHGLLPNVTHIPCIIREDLSEVEARKINVVENLIRKNLNLKQEARVVQDLLDLGLDTDQIAKELGQSRFWVDVRLRLLQLPEDLQDEATAGLLTQEQVMQLTYLRTPEKQRSAVQWLKEQRAQGNRRRLDLLHKKRARRAKSLKDMERIKDMLAYYAGEDSLAWKVAAWGAGVLSESALEKAIFAEGKSLHQT